MNKRLIKLLVIIIILSIIIAIYTFIIHFDGFLDKENRMTREEIVSLLEKGKECSNYFWKPKNRVLFINIDKENDWEFFIKDDIIKQNINGKINTWVNKETNEYITFEEHEGEKVAIVEDLKPVYWVNGDSQSGCDYSCFLDEISWKFDYLGEKKINGRIAILVNVWEKDESKLNSVKYYIDKETGLIMKIEEYHLLGLIKIVRDRNVQLNIVTDKDVEMPNLEDYDIWG